MDFPYRSPFDDPLVREALKERPAYAISLILCPRCGNFSYFHDGSHWSCSVEGCEYMACGEKLDGLIGDDGNFVVVRLSDC